MHSLCCISPVPFERDSQPLSDSKHSKMLADSQTPHKCIKGISNLNTSHITNSSKTTPAVPLTLLVTKNASSSTDVSPEREGGRSSPLSAGAKVFTVTPNVAGIPNLSGELYQVVDGTPTSQASGATSIAGILYKWVNFGKGWRPRWFTLQQGVFSYYKVHGPEKVAVNHERFKGLRLIGEEAHRLVRKQKLANTDDKSGGKASGEVHLKISSLRESKSDDKKFYIYTGTKTLHLRAETKEDRTAWLEALQGAKDLFPRSPVLFGLISQVEEITISTEKLRVKLHEKGLPEEFVQECEDIMLGEFSEVKEQLKLMQHRGLSLLERLRLLEAEKVELETTVVDEMQSQAGVGGVPGLGKYHGGSDTESDDYNGKEVIGDVETDDEDDIFFDTKESLRSFSSSSLLLQESSHDLGSPEHSTKGAEVQMDLVGFDYPAVKRRKGLPDPKEQEKSVSLWSMIKDNIGKDLTRVCLPVYFNEPISSLQRCFEDLEYSYLLDRASEWGKRGNSLMRILLVATFAVSGYSSTEGRTCKPFNPLLGETYEADFPDKGLRFFSEKVSHHPMIVACHCEGRGWKFWADCNLKSKFWGRSIQVDPVGTLTLEFDDGEIFQWTKVTTSIYNLILGKLYVDHYGTMRIQGNRELSCKLKFKEQSIIDRNPHQVQGFVHNKSGEKLATLFGKWDEAMSYVMGDAGEKHKGYDPMCEAVMLWRRNDPPQKMTRYGLTSFAMTLNELTPGLKERLPPTDARLRPDQRHLENGEYDAANAEKLRLEKKQRRARTLQETGWQPQWFRKGKGKDSFEYQGATGRQGKKDGGLTALIYLDWMQQPVITKTMIEGKSYE